MRSINEKFYSGISGVDLPVPRSQYPAEFTNKTRLHYYASLFNSIEINSIFYKLPRHATLIKWAEAVPENFRFTFKVSKKITHIKGLDFATKDVDDFMRTVENIGDKKGCLLAQFPPSLDIEKINGLHNLLEALGEATQNTDWKIAMEFRNSSWYEREVYELLEEFNVTMVIHDIPKSATPINKVHSDIIYLRLHGPEPRYRGDYTDDVLKKYANKVRTWLNEQKTVYTYFNNTAGAAVKNLQTLNGYVNSFNRS